MTLRSGNRCDVCRRAQCLTFQFHPTHLPPEQTRSACCARIISPSAVCTTSRRLHKDSTASLPQSGRRPPLHLARGVIRYGMGYFRRRKQLWGCSQLHLPCRWGNSSVRCREGMEGINCTRAAATDAIHRAAPCAVVPPDYLTPELQEQTSYAALRAPRAATYPAPD